MTESGPRKSLWELMGQKGSEAAPPSTAEQSPPAPADDPESATPENETSAQQSDADESSPAPPAADQPKRKSLWAVMQHSETTSPSESPAVSDDMRSAFEAPVKATDKRLRQMEQAAAEVEFVDEVHSKPAAKRVDKRLQQVEELEVEIVDEPVDQPSSTRRDQRFQRLEEEELEVEIVDEPADELDTDHDEIAESQEAIPATRSTSRIRGIPPPAAIKSSPAVPIQVTVALPTELRPRFSWRSLGKSNNALLSAILGAVSLPLSLISIYPAIWSRIPASVCGFGGLLLGFLAQGELQRAKQKGQQLVLAYAGMGMGLLAMFSGPLIYSPLDLYGQWSNAYSRKHLQQIGMATAAYVQQQHSYPSGGLYKEVGGGKNPEPLHGWMTLLLPHLPEGSGLAKHIDLNKPYSDLANRPVMSQTVTSFLAAGGNTELVQGKFGPAHFAGVGGLLNLPDGGVAHAGIFDINSETNSDDIVDGLSNTMIAGEISTNDPAWGEPHNWRQIGKGLNRDPEGFGNARHNGAMFLMADGSVRFLPNNTAPKVLQALSTRDGEDQP
ncbi:MAG: DUF1559 domain-containing protein [Planctomycetota bacterium]